MSYQYQWSVAAVEGYPEHPDYDALINCISIVHWQLEIRWILDGSVHYLRGATQIGDPDPESFTDHLELSNEDVLGFVWSAIGGRTETEARGKAELAELMAPSVNKIQQLTMPWNSDCCPDGEGIDHAGMAVTTSE